METTDTITSDFLIQELGGCGPFQIIFSAILYFPHIIVAFSTMVMAFGSYNPGWKCLDNSTWQALDGYNITTSQATEDITKYPNDVNYDPDQANLETADDYLVRSCQEFSQCQQVQFNPDVSTVVTEWGLVCDKAWTVPVIMTVQMSGGLVGSLILGYLGDRFGRKVTLYSHLTFHGVMNVISIFSVTWEMFAAVQFILAICHPIFAYLPLAYMREFVPEKSRPLVGSIPIWGVGYIFNSVCAMLTKNWKIMHIIIALMDFAFLLTSMWVPESLRWLSVNKKSEEYLKISGRVAILNKSKLNKDNCMALMKVERERANLEKKFNVFDLFRRGFAKYTIILSFTFVSMNVFYYVAQLGVSHLPGDLFSKMMISAATETPGNIVAALTPNYIGRKKCSSGGVALESLCVFGAVLVNLLAPKTSNTWTIGILVFIFVGKLFSAAAWYVLCLQTAELYPTVVRSTASGFIGCMGVVGALIAPSLIPSDNSSSFTRNYLIMSGLMLMSSILLLFIPETKGKPMKDTFETRTKDDFSCLTDKTKECDVDNGSI